MSMDQLMALVPIEAATTLSTTTRGRRSRWERTGVTGNGKSRFGPKDDRPYLPPPFVDLPPGLTPLQVDQFLREQRLDELTAKLERGELEFGDPDIRPPSPPPAYDKNGNRTNTRDVRVRNAMTLEHQRLLEYMTATVPGFVPPSDYKPVKKIRRIIIPQEKFPEYNFMGLIIGPRGCNHKRLESESGAQISIRGRGTQKEGKKTDHQTEEEAAMPQHIHIAADTEESLDKAVALIEPLLNPYHPAHEEFKKKGLEQLALVNGVSLTKFETRCAVCGALGHLSYECPDTDFQSFQRADVKCALCGDKGHVTMDCKMAKSLTSEQLAEIEKKAQQSHNSNSTNNTPSNHSTGGTTTVPAAPVAAKATIIPPPPARATRLDMEYSQMMSELSGSSDTTTNRSGMNPLDTFSNKFNGSSSGAGPYGTRVIPPPPHATEYPVQDYSTYYNTMAYTYPYTSGATIPSVSAATQPSWARGINTPGFANYYGANLSGGARVAPQVQMDQMSQMMATMIPGVPAGAMTQQQMEQMSQLMTMMLTGGTPNTMSKQQMEQMSQMMAAMYPALAASTAGGAAVGETANATTLSTAVPSGVTTPGPVNVPLLAQPTVISPPPSVATPVPPPPPPGATAVDGEMAPPLPDEPAPPPPSE